MRHETSCDNLGDVRNHQLDEEIERSKIEESVKEELRTMVEDAENRMDINEYHLRRIADTDDGENAEEDTNDD